MSDWLRGINNRPIWPFRLVTPIIILHVVISARYDGYSESIFQCWHQPNGCMYAALVHFTFVAGWQYEMQVCVDVRTVSSFFVFLMFKKIVEHGSVRLLPICCDELSYFLPETSNKMMRNEPSILISVWSKACSAYQIVQRCFISHRAQMFILATVVTIFQYS